MSTVRATRGLSATLLLGASLVATTACGPEMDPDARRARLEDADRRYTAVMDGGDVEGIVSLYAADATRYPPDGEPATGTDAMRAFAERVASMQGFDLTAEPVSLHVSDDGGTGYTLNLLVLTFDGPDGEPMVERLRDFHVWRWEGDGGWRIVEDIWQVLPQPDPVG
jgi:ketosteroid isomerase-like protein